MDQSHQQVQFGLAPEILPVLAVGGVVDDDLRDGLHQIRVAVHIGKAVPCVRIFHIQQVEQPHLIARIPEEARHGLIELSLGVHQDQAVLSFGTLHDHGFYIPAALSGAGASAHDRVLRKTAVFLQRHIVGILVVIIRVILLFAEDRAVQFIQRPGIHDALHFLSLHESAGAVGAVRENIKATFVPDEFVARELCIAFLGDQADEQYEDRCGAQAEGRKGSKPVLERIEHPDALHSFT